MSYNVRVQTQQKMGTWGTCSYDNDSVMDEVGACEDRHDPTQEEADKILDQAFLLADDDEMYYHVLGCVVYFLSHGCDVKLEYLQECIDTFIPHECENNAYFNPEPRAESLKEEFEMIQREINRITTISSIPVIEN
jgi:hypothetical protein